MSEGYQPTMTTTLCSSFGEKKKRNWWPLIALSAMAFVVGGLFMVSTDYEKQNAWQAAQIATVRQATAEKDAIKMTLQVSYPKLNDFEAEAFAHLFQYLVRQYPKVTWADIAATIQIESGFDPTKQSAKGCSGYMQLKDSTASEMARLLHARYTKGIVWWDLSNIYFGTRYLVRCIDSLGYEKGVRGYIAGPYYQTVEITDKKKREEREATIEKYYMDIINEKTKLLYIYKGVMK